LLCFLKPQAFFRPPGTVFKKQGQELISQPIKAAKTFSDSNEDEL
jgi:hypothetical protein